MMFYIPNDIYQTDCQDGHDDRTSVVVKKGIPHTWQTYVPPLLSVEAIRVCIPIGSTVMLLEDVDNLSKDCEMTHTSLSS
jgi:hypothetical protein